MEPLDGVYDLLGKTRCQSHQVGPIPMLLQLKYGTTELGCFVIPGS